MDYFSIHGGRGNAQLSGGQLGRLIPKAASSKISEDPVLSLRRRMSQPDFANAARKSLCRKSAKEENPRAAEAIARLADRGSDVSRFFANTGRMMMPGPIRRVNVDLASGMLAELDRAAKELNISRQAVIKTLIRQALDQQYQARGIQHAAKRMRRSNK